MGTPRTSGRPASRHEDRTRHHAGITAVALGALLLVAAFAIAGCSGGSLPASGNVTNEQAQQVIDQGAVILDVRTAAEFAGGYIDGARNVPMDALGAEIASLDKTKPVLVYCATGSRSVAAMQMLQSAGFEHVYNLTQGIAGWAQAGLDVASPTQTAAGGGGSAPSASGLPVMYEFYTDW